MYVFSQTTCNKLEALLQAQDYPAAYSLLSAILTVADPVSGSRAIDDVAVHQIQLFLEGAALINEDAGAFSDTIRNYTCAQGIFRYGQIFSEQELQGASDEVARSVLVPISANGTLPTIDDTADIDAPAVGRVLFSDLASLNPAWSGVALFPFLGSNQFHRLEDPDPIIELYNEVAFAFASTVTWQQLDPLRFTFDDTEVVQGLVGLWRQLAGLSSSLLDLGAAPSGTVPSGPASIADLVDFGDLAGMTQRVRIGDGGTLTGDGDAELLIGGKRGQDKFSQSAPRSSRLLAPTGRYAGLGSD